MLAAVGVPEMVITFPDHEALTPAGKPFPPDTPLLAMPVAPVVVCVIFVKAVLIHKVGVLEAAPTALAANTVIVPVAILPQLPVNGIL